MKRIFQTGFNIRSGAAIDEGSSISNGLEVTYDRSIKRILDIVLCILSLPVVVPLIVVLAALVHREGGSAFFGHVRVGRDGVPFRCWKLRSMVVDSEERLSRLLEADPIAAAQWCTERKLDNDPRITGLGKFLRKSSLDELPQLYNIIRGDMSFVGPRPVPRDELEENYGDNCSIYCRMRPGLTGLWQVSGRNEVSYSERVQMDLDYYKRISLLTDTRIMLRTVHVVLSKTGK